MEQKFYVTYQDESGGIQSAEVTIEGKVNVDSVKQAVKDSLDYYKRDTIRTIIAWSPSEEFTWDERMEFWDAHK
jgi:ribosome-interacting GTPase 1